MTRTARRHALRTSRSHVAASVGAVAAAREVVAAAVVAVRTLMASLLPAAVARTEAILPATRLADREFRDWTRRRLLAVGPRQRRANQPPMDRTLVLLRLVLLLFLSLGLLRQLRRRRVLLFGDRLALRDFVLRGIVMLVGSVRRCFVVGDALGRAGQNLRRERGRRVRLLALPRNLRVLVFVFRVAGRAARLLDGVADHRDDGVVGHAPLAGTVVVKNVAEP